MRRFRGLSARRSTQVFLFGMLSVLNFFGLSCSAGKAVRYSVVIRDQIVPLAAATGDDYIPFRCTDSESGTLAKGARFEIRSEARILELVSDDEGILRVPLNDNLLREDPWIVCLGDRRITLSLSYTTSLTPNDDAKTRTERVAADARAQLAGNGVSVWFDPGMENDAAEAVQRLEEQRATINRLTGMEPVPWGVILIREKRQDTSYIAWSPYFNVDVWLYSGQELREESFASTNVHEWTESTLNRTLHMPTADPANRFATDGLAEYVRFVHTGQPPNPDALQELLDNKVASVNLLRQFRTIRWNADESLKETFADAGYPPGYGLSFAFWYGLCRTHGDDLSAKFLARVKATEIRDSDSLIHILSELAGESDLRERLTDARVADALELVKTLRETEHRN